MLKLEMYKHAKTLDLEDLQYLLMSYDQIRLEFCHFLFAEYELMETVVKAAIKQKRDQTH